MTQERFQSAWSDAYWSARESGSTRGESWDAAEQATEPLLDDLEDS